MPRRSPTSVYEIRSTFRAPLPFVFAWCTDYTARDPRLEKEKFRRRIVSRSRSRVVYEDLYDTPDGWMWSHWTVTLHPPHRWHADAFGSHRTWSLDYVLRERPGGRTELTLRGRRRATVVGGKNPPKATLERDLRGSWRHFGHALERDYRAGAARRRGRSRLRRRR